ncbi:MAG: hypothetical protein AAF986_09700, partial [Pseudomonadota bacterium]
PVSQYGKQSASLLVSLVLAYLVKLVPDNYSIYLEDADLFAKGTLTNILTTGSVQLTVSHTYIDQLHTTLFAAMLGNCAERYVFRVSRQDADILSRDLPPMSHKPKLDQLRNFFYRRFPYDKSSDQKTLPLERGTI